MHLYDVLGLIRPPNFEEFKIYLQQVEVYGGGYKDDIAYSSANLRHDQTHAESMICSLRRVLQTYDLINLAL